MSKISIKTDFNDGDILPGSDLSNNFRVIEAGINANEENLEAVIEDAITRLDAELEAITANRGWDWNGGNRVTFFKGTTTQVDNKAISNGQLLYNTETGETALDDNNTRIVTGSGNVISIGDDEPTNPATKLWINPDELLSAEGEQLDLYSTTEIKTNKIWIDGKPIYRKVINSGACSLSTTATTFNAGISNVETVTDIIFMYRYSTTLWYKLWNLQELGYNLSENEVFVQTSSSATFSDSNIIIEYTKTTD